jgi:hypothetical protein
MSDWQMAVADEFLGIARWTPADAERYLVSLAKDDEIPNEWDAEQRADFLAMSTTERYRAYDRWQKLDALAWALDWRKDPGAESLAALVRTLLVERNAAYAAHQRQRRPD